MRNQLNIIMPTNDSICAYKLLWTLWHPTHRLKQMKDSIRDESTTCVALFEVKTTSRDWPKLKELFTKRKFAYYKYWIRSKEDIVKLLCIERYTVEVKPGL